MKEPKWITPKIREMSNIEVFYDRGFRFTRLTKKCPESVRAAEEKSDKPTINTASTVGKRGKEDGS